MNLFNIPIDKFQFFFLLFIRILGLMFFAPIFSYKFLPMIAKAGFSFFLSIVLFPTLWKTIPFKVFPNSAGYFGAVSWQLLIGFVIGFTIKLAFEAVHLAGETVGFQMGLAIVNVIDPQGSSQVPLLSMFENLLATLLFLVVNAHHWTLKVLVDSFSTLPFDNLMYMIEKTGKPLEMLNFIVDATGNVFIVGIKLAAPVLAILIFVNVGLGIIARTVPQINIFVVGFPIQIAFGFFVLAAALSFFGRVFIDHGSDVHRDVYTLLHKIAR